MWRQRRQARLAAQPAAAATAMPAMQPALQEEPAAATALGDDAEGAGLGGLGGGGGAVKTTGVMPATPATPALVRSVALSPATAACAAAAAAAEGAVMTKETVTPACSVRRRLEVVCAGEADESDLAAGPSVFTCRVSSFPACGFPAKRTVNRRRGVRRSALRSAPQRR